MRRQAHSLQFLTVVTLAQRAPRLLRCQRAPLRNNVTSPLREFSRQPSICKCPFQKFSFQTSCGAGSRRHVVDDNRRFWRSSTWENEQSRSLCSRKILEFQADHSSQRSQSRSLSKSDFPGRWLSSGKGVQDRDYQLSSSHADDFALDRDINVRSTDVYASEAHIRVHKNSQYALESGESVSNRSHRATSSRYNERKKHYRNIRAGNWERRPAEQPTELQHALASGDDLLYGLQSVYLALNAGRRDVHTLYLQPVGAKAGSARKQANTRLRAEIVARAEVLGVRVSERDRGELNVLSGNRPHQGVVLRCTALDYVPLQSLDEGNPGDVFLALDEVRDPQNVGALLRTAHFLGVKGVAVCQKNSAPISPVVSRASAGASEIMDVFGVESMPRFLRGVAEKRWRVLGAAGEHGALELEKVVSGPPTVLVLGSEGDGLRGSVRSCCSSLVRIRPSKSCAPQVDSLNVSVAGALALFHLLR